MAIEAENMTTQPRMAHKVLEALRLSPLLLLALALPHCEAVTGDQSLIVAQNNTRPVARAGADGEAPVGAALSLDGTSSYDPDGDEIRYHWTIEAKPDGSVLTDSPFSVNGDRNSGRTTLTPDVEGFYVFALQVEDPAGVRSDTARVIYRVKSTLDLPIADAGPGVSGLEGESLCLDGSESYDPNGLELAYQWLIVSSPPGSSLTDADLTTTATECCVVPDAPGTIAIRLVVNNGLEDSEPDFAFIGVASTNEGPIAVASVTAAASCDFIRLSGEDSTDPESDPLNYRWELMAAPLDSSALPGAAAFDDANSATPSFYADISGEYTVQLVVDDGEAYSIPVFVEVEVEMTDNNASPVVVPSPDAYVSNLGPSCPTGSSGQYCPEATIPLNALDSFDPDGDPMTFTWEVIIPPLAAGTPACYSLDMRDSYGDGWHNAYVDVHENGTSIGHFTIGTNENGGDFSVEGFCVEDGATVNLYFSGGTQPSFSPGAWDNECSYDLIDSAGTVIFSEPRTGGGPPNGLRHNFTASASASNTGSIEVTSGAETELLMLGPSSCSGEINTYQVEVIVTGTDCVGVSSQATVAVQYHCGP